MVLPRLHPRRGAAGEEKRTCQRVPAIRVLLSPSSLIVDSGNFVSWQIYITLNKLAFSFEKLNLNGLLQSGSGTWKDQIWQRENLQTWAKSDFKLAPRSCRYVDDDAFLKIDGCHMKINSGGK